VSVSLAIVVEVLTPWTTCGIGDSENKSRIAPCVSASTGPVSDLPPPTSVDTTTVRVVSAALFELTQGGFPESTCALDSFTENRPRRQARSRRPVRAPTAFFRMGGNLKNSGGPAVYQRAAAGDQGEIRGHRRRRIRAAGWATRGSVRPRLPRL
jgi:hypothetical protein